jgi:hypothetical protein
MRWRIHQMNLKTTFLNRIIEEEVYIEKPQGFEIHGREYHVCRLNKSLYGFKRAPRAWYSRIDRYLQIMGFTKSEADPNLYFILVGLDPLILVLYIDDFFSHMCKGAYCRVQSRFSYKVKDEGHWFDALFFGVRGMQVSREIFYGQGKYGVDKLMRFGMNYCRSMATHMVINMKKVVTSDSKLVDPMIYRKLIGYLMYLVNSRTNICFVLNTLSQFMVDPRQVHWITTKHVLRYLRGTMEYGLRHIGGDGVRLQGYSD